MAQPDEKLMRNARSMRIHPPQLDQFQKAFAMAGIRIPGLGGTLHKLIHAQRQTGGENLVIIHQLRIPERFL